MLQKQTLSELETRGWSITAFMSKLYECRVVIKLTVQYKVRVCVRGLRLNIVGDARALFKRVCDLAR